MNKEFEHMIANYLDRNYQVNDDVLIVTIAPNATLTLLGIINELMGVFGVTYSEAAFSVKWWIVPKLTTDDKTFYTKSIVRDYKYLEYRFYDYELDESYNVKHTNVKYE